MCKIKPIIQVKFIQNINPKESILCIDGKHHRLARHVYWLAHFNLTFADYLVAHCKNTYIGIPHEVCRLAFQKNESLGFDIKSLGFDYE